MRTSDGLNLHEWHWPASPTARPRGTVLLVHGLGEHLGRYTALAQHLTQEGWTVRGLDHRGHGRSEGRRGDLPQGDSLLADLGAFIAHCRQQAPGTPLVLVGHSLGGLVAARYVAEGLSPAPARWHQPVQALALSSAALDPGLSRFQRVLLAVSSRLCPHLCVGNGLRPEWICHDPAVVAAYRADPLVHDRISATLAGFIAREGAVVQARAPLWSLPTLLLWSGQDRCVRPEGSARLAQALPPNRVQAQPYPDKAHEIFNDPGAEAVWARLSRWLNALPLDAVK